MFEESLKTCKIIAVPKFWGVPWDIAGLFNDKTVPCLTREVFVCPTRESKNKIEYLMLPQTEVLDTIQESLKAKSVFRRWRQKSKYPDKTFPFFLLPKSCAKLIEVSGEEK